MKNNQPEVPSKMPSVGENLGFDASLVDQHRADAL